MENEVWKVRDALGTGILCYVWYKHSLPTQVAKNAKYQHIAFDGFERCNGKKIVGMITSVFEQVAAPQSINDIEAHTGKKRKVGANSLYTLKKVIVECDK